MGRDGYDEDDEDDSVACAAGSWGVVVVVVVPNEDVRRREDEGGGVLSLTGVGRKLLLVLDPGVVVRIGVLLPEWSNNGCGVEEEESRRWA